MERTRGKGVRVAIVVISLVLGMFLSTGGDTIYAYTALEIVPVDDFEPAGEVGGPFTPVSKNYQLTNTVGGVIFWGVEKTVDWLDIGTEWGELDPNESAIVTVSLTSQADVLEGGVHTDTLTFTDIINAEQQTRGVILTTITLQGILEVTPTGDFEPSGAEGGPFTPSSKEYLLTNIGGQTLFWGVDYTAAWMDVDSTFGQLDPNETIAVTVSLTPEADTLGEGIYTDTITFNDITNEAEYTRGATLTIEHIGGVQVDPDSFNLEIIEGCRLTELLTIENDSDEDLTFMLQTRQVSGLGGAANQTDSQSMGRRNEMDRGPKDHNFTIANNKAYKPGELIVRFAANGSGQSLDTADKNQILSSVGWGRIKHNFKIVPGLSVVTLPAGKTVKQALQNFKKAKGILYAQPNYEVKAISTIPDDTRFSDLWGMHNTGQTGGTADADIDAPEAWDVGIGSSEIIVAVIDTGVDYTHPDLAANMWVNEAESSGTPGVDDDGNGYVDDIYGYDFCNYDGNPMDDHYHGTHCAGTIGGVGNNGEGVAGVNWNVRIMALKFLDSGGSGWGDDAIKCIEYSVLMGANLSSNSWGGGGYSQGLKDAIDAAGAAGMLFAAAAGNGGSNNDSDPHYPSSYASESLIAVMATDKYDNKAGFSCYGLVSVDLGAPGVDILSCKPGGGYQYLDGTSMATPHVAGACALLWSMNPAMSSSEVKDILLRSVDQIPALAGKCVSQGRLNLYQAILETNAPWIELDPESGTIGAGGSSDINVTFDTMGLTPGTYEAEIVLISDSLADPIIVPVTMTVVPDDLQVTGPEGFDSSGTEGGPFEPECVVYTLTNINATESVNWTALDTEDWLQIIPSEGLLGPSEVVDVNVCISVNADLLDPNVYTDTLTFQNTESGSINQYPVSLTVKPPDCFTESFDDNGNDLSGFMATFTPDGSIAYYEACRERVVEFPVDPNGSTYVELWDDDFVEVPVAGGKEILFYGTYYDRFYIGSNGYITFGDGDTEYLSSLENHFDMLRISGLFADLAPPDDLCISYEQFEDSVVVTFEDVPLFGDKDGINSFQIEMFFADGSVRIAWLDIADAACVAGLSRGIGIPPVFFEESDLNEYPACWPLCDFDRDYSVNFADLTVLALHWLDVDCDVPYWCGKTDLDFSGTTDTGDFGIFSENWLTEMEKWWLWPISHWKFDEGEGDTAYDSVGNNDGTLVGDPGWVAGRIGDYALDFDGDGDYVQTTCEDGPPEYSISLWYNLNEDIDTSEDMWGTLVSKTGDEVSGVELWSLWFHGYQGLRLQSEKTETDYAIVAYKPPMFYGNQWHHIVATGTSAQGTIYFDGELKSSTNDNFVTGAWDDSVPLNIGRPYFGDRDPDQYFNGKIDEIRIYDRVLSDEEIEELYQEGLSYKAVEPTPADGATGVNPNGILSWLAGRDAISHDVYLGTSFDAVNDADTLSDEYMGRQDANNWDPCELAYETTYFWRIDEVGASKTYKGDVWSFATFDPNLGLNAHWKFDEGEGDTAYDLVGNNDGTLIGDPGWVAGRIGDYALDFDGDGDYVQTTCEDGPLEYSISLWFNLNEDIDPSGAEYSALVSKTGDEVGGVELWSILFAGDNKGLRLINEKTETNYAIVEYEPPIFYGNQWHHVVAIGSGTQGRIYFDGELKSSANDNFVTGAWDDSVPVNIGRPYLGNADRFFNGKIDEIRIYDRVLSDEEIEALYQEGFYKATAPNPTDAATDVNTNAILSWSPGNDAISHEVYLGGNFDAVNDADEFSDEFKGNQTSNSYDPCDLAYETAYFWRIDEVGASTTYKGDVWSLTTLDAFDPNLGLAVWWKFDGNADDSSGHGYDGTLMDDATIVSDPDRDLVLSLDGDSDYVRTTYESGPPEYSISLWYNLNEDIDTSEDMWGALVSKTGDEVSKVELWSLWFHGYQGLRLQNEKVESSYAIVAYKPSIFYANQWHHIVATGTSTQGRIYFDGDLKSSANNNFLTGAWDDSVPFNIGRPYLGSAERFFDGMLDDVRIYDKVLSDEEVEQLYHDGL